eukprot:GHVU01066509.1.p1 GENE.GHVU01066509.1~~GHVU01066509.1.p1  ORF type:complete len:673 (+),score=112.25 GHVU01066509.1:179-2020(+)
MSSALGGNPREADTKRRRLLVGQASVEREPAVRDGQEGEEEEDNRCSQDAAPANNAAPGTVVDGVGPPGGDDSGQHPSNAVSCNECSSSAPVAEATSSTPVIVLESWEHDVFDQMLQFVRETKVNTVMRVAGGWVRDKLLGKPCHDVDVAVDDCSGTDFAERFKSWLSGRGISTSSVGTIRKNPDQSKHLETATMRMGDMWVDFVNLRSESYTEESRIPSIAVGTAEEDAYRRDFTVNALFYNLNEKKVEDMTGRGLEALRKRLLSTPLPPADTFTDDPLRVLRAIRFRCQLDFEIAPDVVAAFRLPPIAAALQHKVSRERIGIEVDKMMRTARATAGAKLILENGLFESLFAVEGTWVEKCIAAQWPSRGVAALERLDDVLAACGALNEPPLLLSPDDVVTLRYACLFSPFRGLQPPRNKDLPAETTLLRTQLKRPNKDADRVSAVLRHVAAVPAELLLREESRATATSDALEAEDESLLRLRVGRFVRTGGDLWRLSVLAAAVLESPKEGCLVGGDGPASPSPSQLPRQAAEQARLAIHFCNLVDSLGLQEAHKLCPFVTGKELTGILPQLKPGPNFKPIIEFQMDYRMSSPSSTKEECIEAIKKKFPEFT